MKALLSLLALCTALAWAVDTTPLRPDTAKVYPEQEALISGKLKINESEKIRKQQRR